MAPRTPIDIDNPSWGDWLRGTIRYGESLDNQQQATDTLPDRSKFVDAMRPEMSGWGGVIPAFGLGLKSTGNQGLTTGGMIDKYGAKTGVPDEAMRKMDYAAGQLQPVAHLAGAGVGAGLSAADYALSLLDGAEIAKGIGKGASWLWNAGARAAPEGAIGAWTSASALPARAGYLARILEPVGKAVVSAAKSNPIAASLGGLGLGSYLGGTVASNYVNKTGEKFAKERAAEAQAAQSAQEPSAPTASQVDPSKLTPAQLARYLDGEQMSPAQARMQLMYDKEGKLKPGITAEMEAQIRTEAEQDANARNARYERQGKYITLGRAIGIDDPQAAIIMGENGQFTRGLFNNILNSQQGRTTRMPTARDLLYAEDVRQLNALQEDADNTPAGAAQDAKLKRAIDYRNLMRRYYLAPSSLPPDLNLDDEPQG